MTIRTFKEIEFLCANSDFPDYAQTLDKHKALFKRLQRPGLLPYRQDFSNDYNLQLSLAVIILDPTKEQYVLKQAKEVGLPIDVVSQAPQWKVEEVQAGRADYQVKPKRPPKKKHTKTPASIRGVR